MHDDNNSGFDDDLLAIDVDALVVGRETLRLENMTKQLKEIVLTLAGTHAARSLPLTTEQSDTYFVYSFWMYVYKKEMINVRECAVDRRTQLVSRNKKLILMDTELCRSFAKEKCGIMTEQSVLFVLCHEFIKVSRSFRYSSDHLRSLPSFIRDIFSCSDVEILGNYNRVAQETLYYITGWTIHAVKKIAPRRKKDTRHALVYLANSVTVDDLDGNQKSQLPTGKVDRLISFGGLCYATYAYFVFMARMETIYSNILSEEYIVALGTNIVEHIRLKLKSEAVVIDLLVRFVPPSVSPKCFSEVVDYLFMIYSRMRGKDFAMKLLKKNATLKLPVRQIQAVLSDPKHRIKKSTVNLGEDCLTEEERLQNAEFTRIVKELDEEWEE